MIVSGFLYAALAALAVIEVSASRRPRSESRPLVINLLETGIILAWAEARGWKSGLIAFVLLVALLQGGRRLAHRASQRAQIKNEESEIRL